MSFDPRAETKQTNGVYLKAQFLKTEVAYLYLHEEITKRYGSNDADLKLKELALNLWYELEQLKSIIENLELR